MPLSLLIVLGALGGFIGGVAVNLIADYVPARRLHYLAKASPFTSANAIPPIPPPFPNAPVYAWSGWVAWLSGQRAVFATPRWRRRLAVELGLALLWGWIVATYAADSNLPFYLFYALPLVLYVVIDVEYRWIIWGSVWPVGLVALLEAIIAPRGPLITIVRGGLYGFGIMLLLYFLGILFGEGLGALSRRRVGRTVLGFGDVRLAALGGLLLGWPGIGFALLIMVFTGAFGAIIFITDKMARTRRYRAFSAIPYGPYVVIGIALMLYAPWIMGDILVRLAGGE